MIMSKRYIHKIFGLVALVAMAGCADNPAVVPLATEPDIVSTRIAAASEKASTALETISDIEQQRTPPSEVEDFSNAPPGLAQLITVKWTGPVEQIVNTLAIRSGMTLHIKGARPPVPVTVTVDAYQQPMIEMLRDLGLQSGRRADITIDAPHGVIEIRYAPVDRI